MGGTSDCLLEFCEYDVWERGINPPANVRFKIERGLHFVGQANSGFPWRTSAIGIPKGD
jgi:hypothetical protein